MNGARFGRFVQAGVAAQAAVDRAIVAALPDVDRVARAFHAIVRSELAGNLRVIDQKNRRWDRAEKPGRTFEACATHDYTDANMLMFRALTETLGREPDLEADADVILFNAAWERARSHGFSKEWPR